VPRGIKEETMPRHKLGTDSGKGAKYCDKCHKNGACIDTRREQGGYVRRRYKCVAKGCTNRWTTVEHRIAPVKGRKYAVEARFMEQMQDKARKELQSQFAGLLGLKQRG
jgi:hypothetical protein